MPRHKLHWFTIAFLAAGRRSVVGRFVTVPTRFVTTLPASLTWWQNVPKGSSAAHFQCHPFATTNSCVCVCVCVWKFYICISHKNQLLIYFFMRCCTLFHFPRRGHFLIGIDRWVIVWFDHVLWMSYRYIYVWWNDFRLLNTVMYGEDVPLVEFICTFNSLACQVRPVQATDWGLCCCVCVNVFPALLNSHVCWF